MAAYLASTCGYLPSMAMPSVHGWGRSIHKGVAGGLGWWIPIGYLMAGSIRLQKKATSGCRYNLSALQPCPRTDSYTVSLTSNNPIRSGKGSWKALKISSYMLRKQQYIRIPYRQYSLFQLEIQTYPAVRKPQNCTLMQRFA